MWQYLEEPWISAKPFLVGFRRHIKHFVPAFLILPFEIYERILGPCCLSDVWPEHLVVPASAFPWVLSATFVWVGFQTYRDLHQEYLAFATANMDREQHNGSITYRDALPQTHSNIRLGEILDKYHVAWKRDEIRQAAFEGRITISGRQSIKDTRWFEDVEEPIPTVYWRYHELDTTSCIDDKYGHAAQTRLCSVAVFAKIRSEPKKFYTDLRVNESRIKEILHVK